MEIKLNQFTLKWKGDVKSFIGTPWGGEVGIKN